MPEIKVKTNSGWVSECGCRERLANNTWSPALKNGDRVRDNAGNWLPVTCPVVTFDVTLNEQTDPVFSGANVQVKNLVTGQLHDTYAGHEVFSFDDVYEGSQYVIDVYPENYTEGNNNSIHIVIYKNGDPTPVHDATIPGAVGDPDDPYIFTPAPGDSYVVVVDVTADAPPPPATFYAENDTPNTLHWTRYTDTSLSSIISSGTVAANGDTLDIETMLAGTSNCIAFFAPADGDYQLDYPPLLTGTPAYYNTGDLLTTVTSADIESYKGSGYEYLAISPVLL